ncbi:LamG-like jellyroll fold domain-containing protein, partial [Colwellia sp. 12G3]|uniref:LamG-like jellyroll fold domain-containing protein n=1 Tax=Colwellia sp. 12G3 TaxID=2058299 RepID=UPI000CB643F7
MKIISKLSLSLFLTILTTFSCFALISPVQDYTLYFEESRGLKTQELNGKVFDQGFSFTGWFKFSKLPQGGGVITGYNWESFVITHDGTNLEIWLNQNNVRMNNLQLDSWVNLAITYDKNTLKVFLNGELQGSPITTTNDVVFPIGDGVNFLVSGFYEDGFYGKAKQFKIWERALSDDELSLAINNKNSNESIGIKHQWLMDSGQGNEIIDSVGAANFKLNDDINTKIPLWHFEKSPYEFDVNSINKVYSSDKNLPFVHVWGVADFNQDGLSEIFVHGGNDYDSPDYTSMLIFADDGIGNFFDASDSMIDGGLYYKTFPSGRETLVHDFNGDGYDDIFVNQGGDHGNDRMRSESDTLLLSSGNSGKLYPKGNTIKSLPCTLNSPSFEGQKPCQWTEGSRMQYPDPNAELVDVDIRTDSHGSTVADIDNDGDLDIFVVVVPFPDKKPVQPYFLINDGNGNFTANWQLVPNKAFAPYTDLYTEGEFEGEVMTAAYVIARLDDFDNDGFIDLALFGSNRELAARLPPIVEQDLWFASAHELIAWGDATGFSEEYTVLESVDSHFIHTNAHSTSVDIDNDGDLDIIIPRDNGNDGAGLYIQIFRNEGNRIFKDMTQMLLPQTLSDAKVRQSIRGVFQIDLNKDGCIDFMLSQPPQFVTAAEHYAPHRIWLNNCAGYFTAVDDSLFGKVGLMLPLDLDNDGGLDFVTMHRGLSNNNKGEYLEITTLKQIADINIDLFIDTDSDGVKDQLDNDDDGDGVSDTDDLFPKDANESVDTDGDGIGNNADTDDDGDGVLDTDDAFLLDANES